LKNLKKIFSFILFIPLLIFFGKRSLIAFDEGFYALQAKWILENNNWTDPLWWGELSLDRTIGIQYLIALSQKIFGSNLYTIHIPTTLAAAIMIFLTYQLQKELVKSKYKLASSLILSTTFIWINYAHLATQDIIFAAIITLGIISSIYSSKLKNNIYFFLSGFWIGIAFMMKTFLVFIPLLGIFPFFYKSKIFNNKLFWVGLAIGFLPFLFWSIHIFTFYGQDSYFGLFEKLIFLSKKNNFTNPFYYYLWNLPLNIFPWSIFAIIGFINSRNIKDELSRYFLFTYPLIILVLMSLFSTKTPYYPLQILSLISINSYLGIEALIGEKKKYLKILNFFLFYLSPITFILALIYINIGNINLGIFYYQKILLSIGLISLSIIWLYSNKFNKFDKKIPLILIGPYVLTFFIVQSGLITDRSKDLRIEIEKLVKEENLNNKKIEVIKSELGDQTSISKIIKISVLTPKIGNGILSIDDLEKNQYAWTKLSKKDLNENKFTLISEADIFKPWKIIKKF
tara:strand:+ start:982 stop:2520 length:1539 start_codon:yes stop_codon:yes gene_type:complete